HFATFDIRTLPQKSPEELQSLPLFNESTGFAAAGRRFFVGRSDGVVQAWEETDTGVARLPLVDNPLPSTVEMSPDGRWLAATAPSAKRDVYGLRLWSLHGGVPAAVPLPEELSAGAPGVGATFSANGQRLAVWTVADGAVRIWDVAAALPQPV